MCMLDDRPETLLKVDGEDAVGRVSCCDHAVGIRYVDSQGFLDQNMGSGCETIARNRSVKRVRCDDHGNVGSGCRKKPLMVDVERTPDFGSSGCACRGIDI